MSLNPLAALLELGKIAIDKIWPDPIKRAEEYRKLEELAHAKDIAYLNAEVQLLMGQIEVNKVEASHPSIFVAGWRPYTGWVAGTSFAYMAIIEPLMRFICTLNGYEGPFPELDTTITMQILLGLLGLGVMRSYDKQKKVDTKGVL